MPKVYWMIDHSVNMVILDFVNAFDILCETSSKLEAYGKTNILVKRIESFLTGRKQRIIIVDNNSE